MKRIINAIVGFTLTCTISAQVKAQDVHFSQFQEVTILRNPALTGVFNGDYRLGAHYKNQWSNISNAPFQTALLSAELKKAKSNGSPDFWGLGFSAYADRTGSINLTTISLNLAASYNKVLNENKNTFLSFGILAGYLQRNFDPSKMTLSNHYEPGRGVDLSRPSGENLPNPKLSQIDAGIGINYSSNIGNGDKTNISIGASAYHLTKPENNFYGNLAGVRQEMRFNINGAINYIIDDMWSSQILANISLQGKHYEAIAGGLIGKKTQSVNEDILIFYAGLFYRFNDAIIPAVKINYNDLTFGISYDLNASKLTAATKLRGGVEISAVKTGLLRDPQRSFNKTVCPVR